MENGQPRTCKSMLHHVCMTSSDAVITVALDGRIMSTNQATSAIFGYPKERMLQQSLTDIVPTFDVAILHGQQGYLTHMVTCEHADGKPFAAEMLLTPFDYHDETLYLGIIRDMSDQQVFTTSVDLSPRQRQVLKLVIEGYTSREIAEQLIISIKTVETHRANIMAKFGVRNVSSLVRAALEMDIM